MAQEYNQSYELVFNTQDIQYSDYAEYEDGYVEDEYEYYDEEMDYDQEYDQEDEQLEDGVLEESKSDALLHLIAGVQAYLNDLHTSPIDRQSNLDELQYKMWTYMKHRACEDDADMVTDMETDLA